jgi:ABC-type sulfate transport system permease component
MVFRLHENFEPAEAYVVALTLAAVSIVLLTGIELAKHRMRREQTR